MIYSINESNIDNRPLFLTGSDADEFLEANGIQLYDEHVIIGESLLPGAEAEDILAENGIYLYEDGIVLEGMTVEDYYKKKQNAAIEKKKKEEEVINDKYGKKGRRLSPGYGFVDPNTGRETSTPTTDRNPAFDKARKLRDMRKTYGSVMPRRLTKTEFDLAHAEDLEKTIARKASNIANDESWRRYDSGNYNRFGDTKDIAEDKLRKNLRKQFKKRGYL